MGKIIKKRFVPKIIKNLRARKEDKGKKAIKIKASH